MDLHTDEAPETELNMTPMIDIVFQLIIFFLLSLKFKTIDRRIESMLPKDRGPSVSSPVPIDEHKIKFKVFRRELADSAKAYTLVKLDNSMQFRLPSGWKGRRLEPQTRIDQYDAVIARITDAVRERVAIYGGSAVDVKGEIVAPLPHGGAVPHGDVVALLNTFIEVGMLDVRFEGTANPLNKADSEARAQSRR